MATWPAVIGVIDGEYLEEDVLNRSTRQLRERTDWLRQRIEEVLGVDGFQSLRLVDVPLTINSEKEPEIRDFVYLNPETKTYEKALASPEVLGTSVYELAKDEAYSVGILISKSSATGTVVIAGKLQLADSADWDLATLLADSETFRPGPYYLSTHVPGKMTAEPKGPAVYLGYFVDDVTNTGAGGYAVLSPQYKDVGEAHVHRAFELASQPSGSQSVIGSPPAATHKLFGFLPPSESDDYHDINQGPTPGFANDPAAATDAVYPATAPLVPDAYVGLKVTNTGPATAPQNKGSGYVTANDTTTVTLDNATIVWDDGDVGIPGDGIFYSARTRLIVIGDYASIDDSEYVLVLAEENATDPFAGAPGEQGVNGPIAQKEAGFTDIWLHWQSSDPNEGVGKTKVISYEVPVAFGTKGLKAVFENVLEDDSDVPNGNEYWNWGENSHDTDRRIWTISAPNDIRGWQTRRYRQFTVPDVSVDNGYSLVVFGGPLLNPSKKFSQDINVATGFITLLEVDPPDIPADGDLLTIGSVSFEMDDNDTLNDPENVPIPVVLPGNEFLTTLRDVINDRAIPGVTAVTYAPPTATTQRLFILAPVGTAITNGLSLVTESIISTGVGAELTSGAAIDANFIVYDENYDVLVDEDGLGVTNYWAAGEFYVPQTLTNNLKLMFIPFQADGTPFTSGAVAANDSWYVEVVDEAPGALFRYNVQFDSDLSSFYPPKPFRSASLVVNGLEQSSAFIHDVLPSWQPGNEFIYWFTDKYANIPWPANWDSVANPGTALYTVHTTFHSAYMRLDDTGFVTSLKPAPGSSIKVLRCGTSEEASTGDLMLDVDLSLSAIDAGTSGYKVVKDVSGTQLLKGPVVSKISGGSGIVVASKPGQPEGQGEVTISLAESAGFAGDFEEIALQNAKQELIGLFPYIRLLPWETGSASNIPSGITAKVSIPVTLTGNFQVLVYLTVFGEQDIEQSAGSQQFVGVDIDYSVLRDYSPFNDADSFGTLTDNLIENATTIKGSIPLGKTGVSAYPSGEIYKAYDPLLIHNNPGDTAQNPGKIYRSLGSPFPTLGDLKAGTPEFTLAPIVVQPGSNVAFSIRRGDLTSPNEIANEYPGNLGIMKLRWRLAAIELEN